MELNVIGSVCASILFIAATACCAIDMKLIPKLSQSMKLRWIPIIFTPTICGILAIAILGDHLFSLWSQRTLSYGAIGGFIPWSDAGGYLNGARTLIESGQLTEWACRRPIHSVFLGTILGIFGQNLLVTHFALLLLVAGATLLVIRSSSKYFGTSGLILAALGLSSFIADFIGLTLSELTGYVLGCLAFCLLMKETIRPLELILATCVLCLGLCARAGPFLILPLLALPWNFYRHYLLRGSRWVGAGCSTIGMAIGFSINHLITQEYCSAFPKQVPFSNFLYTKYGLAKGNSGWKAVFADHPDWIGLSDGEMASRLIPSIKSILANDPTTFAVSLAKNSILIPTQGLGLLWNFTPGILEGILWFAALLWLGKYYFMAPRNSQTSAISVLFLGNLGIFLSAPILMAEGEPRVFAAAIPFYIGALAWLISKCSRQPPAGGQGRIVGSSISNICSILFIVALGFSLPLAQLSKSTLSATNQTCATNETPITSRITKGAELVVVDNYPKKAWLTVKKKKLFIPDTEIKLLKPLQKAVPPYLLASVMDISSSRQFLVYAEQQVVNPRAHYRLYCIENISPNHIPFTKARIIQEVE